MKIVSLGSGSKGNSFYLGVNGKDYLIDCGLSMKQINRRLLVSVGLDLEDIDVIFITHKHSDHISSMMPIVRKYEHIKFAMPSEIHREFMEQKKTVVPRERRIEIPVGKTFRGKDVDVKATQVNHDVFTVAYKFTDKSNGQTYLHLPDNGGIYKNKMIEEFKGMTYYAIESNHDLTQEIFRDKDAILKRRVLGYYGHTHNADAINLAFRLVGKNTKGIIFHHLSDDCNTPELCEDTHDELIEIWGNKRMFANIKRVYALQDEIVELV